MLTPNAPLPHFRDTWKTTVTVVHYPVVEAEEFITKVSQDGIATANINWGGWGARIQIHGISAPDAEGLRAWVLDANLAKIAREKGMGVAQ